MSAVPDTPVVVVAGPTASGKSALALAWAERFGGEIVNADSIQMHRGLDIGSAKPTLEERARVPHHLLDVLTPVERIDAKTYADLADTRIADIHARRALPIVVGGTGLWLRALLRGLVDVPAVDADLRRHVEAQVDALGPDRAHARLTAIDPDVAARVHPRDRLRIVRALEVYEATGTSLGALQAAHAKGAARYRSLSFVVDSSRAELAARIDARLEAMIAAGFVDEVAALVATYGDDAHALKSVGYRQIVEHVVGRTTIDAAIVAAKKATRDYARRQRNWFTSEPDFARLDPSDHGAPEVLRSLARWAASARAG